MNILLLVAVGVFALGEVAEVRDVMSAVVSRDIAAVRQVASVREAEDLTVSTRSMALDRYREARTAAGTATATATARGGPDGGGDGFRDATAEWSRHAAETARRLDGARMTVEGFAADAVSPVRRKVWTDVAASLRDASDQLVRLRDDTVAVFDALRRGDDAAAAAAVPRLESGGVAFDASMERVAAQLDAGARAGQDRVQAVYETSRWSVIAAVAMAVAVAGVLTALIRRAVSGPIAELGELARRIGEGDLAAQADGRRVGELGRLGGTLDATAVGLRRLVGQNREASENLSAAVAQIRASTQQQAAGVEEQLAAVQETAATVDEIAHSGSQITRRAREVIGTAEDTGRSTVEGLKAVRESGLAMEQVRQQGEAVAATIVALSEKTAAIADIIMSVNDISERSHLLALNAAIEAATAGEHGRSFAVVANEMKILADQAKTATGQVRVILGDIQRGINSSVMLTEEAVKRGLAGKARTQLAEATIEEMAAGIQEAVGVFQQIVASTNQQQLGIEQVTAALQNIRDASRQTAAGTRQLDQAASGLGELSRLLMATTERFKL
ncbi:MAG: methyl-accepting chemotaxis protein [Gluconacetobacter diazotrophicus]|nr:methyl-accepting chemotaxis protein [Gluconacetobacter diazotrophicus]